MPNNKNIKVWIEALRSGEYEQGVGSLRTGSNQFCCLGVACEKAVEAGVIDPPRLLNLNPTQRPENGYYEYEGEAAQLPERVSEWLGFDFENFPQETLIEFNDSVPLTFDDIADWIEVNLLDKGAENG